MRAARARLMRLTLAALGALPDELIDKAMRRGNGKAGRAGDVTDTVKTKSKVIRKENKS